MANAKAEVINLKLDNVETVKKLKYTGTLKKRKWEERITPSTSEKTNDETSVKNARVEDNTPKIRRRKFAMLLSYSGVNYYGMQRNIGMNTIEEDLITALFKAKLINEENFRCIQSIQFQRAARTDKGVSAARQCVSLKLPETVTKEMINEHLPECIRIFSIKRVTKGFNSKNQCNARTYAYMLPTYAFTPHDEIAEVCRKDIIDKIENEIAAKKKDSVDVKSSIDASSNDNAHSKEISSVEKSSENNQNIKKEDNAIDFTSTLSNKDLTPEQVIENKPTNLVENQISAIDFELFKKKDDEIFNKLIKYRTNDDVINQVNEILKLFLKTKNFHNFTSKKKFSDPSSNRFIMSFECGNPFVMNDVEFVIMKVKGQSFMLHQIRKMVGIVLSIIRGVTKIDTLNRTLTEERLDIPMAPGLGLILEQAHYDWYAKRYEGDGIHETLDWKEEDEQVEEFKKKYIYSNIVETEIEKRCMYEWCKTLPYHSYDVREDDFAGQNEKPSKASNSQSDDDE